MTTLNYQNGAYQNTSTMTNTYQWWGGAVQHTQQMSKAEGLHTTTYAYDQIGGQAQLTHLTINDGRPRTVLFVNDLQGQAIKRDEVDSNTQSGDPHEVWYRFAGKQIGYVGNNGTLDTGYAQSVYMRTAAVSTGPFRGGGAALYADFDQSLPQINSYFQGGAAGGYTVQAGETLRSIAARLYGDASLWWQIAEANGLSGEAPLAEGQTLILPAGAIKNTHNASTFTPYDPAEL